MEYNLDDYIEVDKEEYLKTLSRADRKLMKRIMKAQERKTGDKRWVIYRPKQSSPTFH